MTLKMTVLASLASIATLTGAVAAPKVTLDFPSWQAEEPGLSDWWKGVIADYEQQNPDVKINFYMIPFASYIQQMTVRFAGNNAPDIVHLPTRNFAAFASQDWLMPIDDLIAKTDILQTWTPLQDELRWDGKVQGVLLMGYGYMLFYNDQILKDAKVDVPTTPAAWVDAIKKTTNRDKGVFGVIANTVEHPNFVVELGTWVTGEKASFFDDKGHYAMTSPALVKAVDQFREAMAYAPPGMTSETARQLFIDGKGAFLRDGPFVWSSLKKAKDDIRPHLKVTRLPFPVVAGGTSNSLHMAATLPAEKKAAVWKFIELCASPKWQERYPVLASSPAPRKGSLTEATLKEMPHLKVIQDSAAEAVSVFPAQKALRAGYNEYAKIFAQYAMKMVTTKTPTAEILGAMQKELDRVLPIE
jgi:multiple sugar transport system substrate-binding protein